VYFDVIFEEDLISKNKGMELNEKEKINALKGGVVCFIIVGTIKVYF
jgi:hypothetical protein